ncbi:MAG: polyphosphate:AMP phosphotransferase [Proteobacteria bacterium]|nr:MAG: polyphosphate:AMP phosphotransferase [Pseudomonadota bacterium]
MFEAAEIGNSVAKADYDVRVPALRVDLINAQYDLRHAEFSVVVVLTGDDRAGVNETLNVLHEWMDPRWIRTRAFDAPSAEERERPGFWRYWKELPRRGQLSIVIGDWSTRAILARLSGRVSDAHWARTLEHIESFERMLADDGTLLLKFWLHLPKKELKRRLKRARTDDGAALRVDATDRLLYEHYDDAQPVAEQVLRKTSTAATPWTVVESTDAHYRDLTVAGGVLAALRARQASGRPLAPPAVASAADADPHTTVLGSVDLAALLPYDVYRARLLELQSRLRARSRKARKKGVSSVVVLEGWDAAGKGGVIRRIVRGLDARDYRVVPVGAPTEEESAHHYLWRFWKQLPRAGKLVIFDRSWYGRVLVERVEGLASAREWRRAYSEINDFEDQIVEHGSALAKFWLHVSPDEQLRRFEAREKTPYKKYKIGADDYRNRDRWDEYVAAVDEMVARTGGVEAPWHLVPANDKRFARVAVLETLCGVLERALDRA